MTSVSSTEYTGIQGPYQYPAYPILNANTDGAQLEKSMHILSEQMEEIKTKEAALKESSQKCEEQKALVQKQFETLKHKMEEFQIKESLPGANPPQPNTIKIEQSTTSTIAIGVLKSTGQVLKENWKTAVVLSVITAGAVWVYHKIQTTTIQLPKIEIHGGLTKTWGGGYECDMTITPVWPKP